MYSANSNPMEAGPADLGHSRFQSKESHQEQRKGLYSDQRSVFQEDLTVCLAEDRQNAGGKHWTEGQGRTSWSGRGLSDTSSFSGQTATESRADLGNVVRRTSTDSARRQQNMHPPQAPTERTLGETADWARTHTLGTLKLLKSYNVCSQTTVQLQQKSITERQLENTQVPGD